MTLELKRSSIVAAHLLHVDGFRMPVLALDKSGCGFQGYFKGQGT